MKPRQGWRTPRSTGTRKRGSFTSSLRSPSRPVPPSVLATVGEGQAAPMSGQRERLPFLACTINLGKAIKQHLARVFRPYFGVARGMHSSTEPVLGRSHSTQTLEECQPRRVPRGAFYTQETDRKQNI